MKINRRTSTRTSAWLLAAGVTLAVAASGLSTAHATQDTASVASVPNAPQAEPLVLKTAASTESSAFAEHLESKYIDPDRIYSTDVRWWLGEAAHTDETLLEEIQALYDAGFRGVELCMQNDNGASNADYAYGSAMWTHKWNLIMNKLLDLGMSVYLTSGTNWATSNVPGLDPVSQQAMQNLTLGTSVVQPGQTLASLQAPAANARRAGARFVTAYAYKVVSGNAVDPASYINLNPAIVQGADVWTQNVDWTAPSDGTYRVFGLWTQGTYQSANPAAQTSYATNYFDERGVEALREFWEAHYLSDPVLREKIKNGDVQLFMDSLEISFGSGGMTWWAEDMTTEFQKRKGYDITPYLFLIQGVAASVSTPYHSVGNAGTYKLDGDEARRRGIVNDYQDVLTQLYRERMLQPLKTWLNSVGIETRAQISYGKPLEISEPAMDVDYPEAENLNQYNQVDILRLWTGAAKLENKVLSTETGAELLPYNATRQMHLRDAYSQYAAGFQRTIWHVWAAQFGYGNHQWPGYSPWSNMTTFHFFGNRHPGARDYDEFNAHLGRVQQLMQTGKSRTDVGFLHQNWTQGIQFHARIGDDNTRMQWQLAHQGVYYRSTELQDHGYTYDYFSPKFLFSDDVHFDKKTKTIEKAGYKAVVLYQDWLDLEGAKRILAWAKQGLKVVILENAASRTPFNDGKDSALKKVTDELKTLPTVRQATVYDNIDYFSNAPGGYDDNVMEKLLELGVSPYAGYPEENLELLNQTREDDDGNRYVYLYNYGDDEYHKYSHKPEIRNVKFGPSAKTDLVMEGQFQPYSIDAWTGKVTELADYRWENGKTIVPVEVDKASVELLAFEKVDSKRLHVIDTNAESARSVDGGVAVRATESGTLTTELSNGERYQDDVSVPASYDITDWDLTVESWRPGATAGDLLRTEEVEGLTTVNRMTSTAKTLLTAELETLKTWNEIPEIGKAVSGTGRYEATFQWDAASASGAYLDFGDRIEESMEVWINGRKVGGDVSTNPTKVKRDVGGVGKPTIDDGTGQQVPLVGDDLYTGGVSWTRPIADVSPYLVDGSNEIVIEYSSALANVQLDRGAIPLAAPHTVFQGTYWWGNDSVYLDFGPKQAKLVPFVDVKYAAVKGGSDGPPAAGAVATTVSAELIKKPTSTRKGKAVIAVLGGASAATGQVKVVYKRGKVKGKKVKVVKRVALGADGTVTVTLPRSAKGTRTLKVTYLGDATHLASAVTKMKVKVTR